MDKHETIQTPNVLGIYLLAKQLERWNAASTSKNSQAIKAKAKLLDKFVQSHKQLNYFVKAPSARSQTTICIEAQPEVISKLHAAALKANLVVGSGYGKLKSRTCRVANFPALTENDMSLLIKALAPALG